MKHLSASDLSHLRDLLQSREATLSAEIDSLLSAQRASSPGGREVDAAVADLEHSLGFADALRDQNELDDIHSALGRMDLGTYGRCLCCGARIPIEPLRAFPSAALCLVCQTRAEAGEAPEFLSP